MMTLATKPVRVRFQHSSMQFSDPHAQMAYDLDTVFGRGADVITGTEGGKTTDLWDLIPAKGKKAGYAVIHHEFGEWIAVDTDFGTIVDSGFIPVNAGQSGPANQGGHTPKGILWVEIEHEYLGTIFYCVAHWMTGYFWGGKTHEHRRIEHTVMTNALTEFVREQGKGRTLCFFAGDMNFNDELTARDPNSPTVIFERENLTTIWDEMGTHPSTHGGKHGGTIDIIGSYDLDRRVVGIGGKAHPHGKRYKDHFDITALYDIAPPHHKGR